MRVVMYSYVWYEDIFRYWLAMIRLEVRHEWLMCVMTYSMCDMTYPCVWYDVFIWLMMINVHHDVFRCVTWHIHICVTWYFQWHDVFIWVTRSTFMCDMTYSDVWRDIFRCVTWRVHTLTRPVLCMYKSEHRRMACHYSVTNYYGVAFFSRID